METNSIQIKFDGREHQIDANTLINTLTHYNSIINEVNREHSGGSKDIKIQINAIEKGSFIIDLSVVGILGIFSAGNVGYLADVVTIASGVFAAYKLLKGRPAKDDKEKQSVSIFKNAKINNSIINVYNQPLIREAISKSIETANEDPSVESVNFITKDNPTVTYDKKDFSDLIYNDFDKENDIPQERNMDVDTNLVIKALNFEKGGRWEFYYQGNPIKIVVKDDALMKVINKGERFGKGDSIKVKLRVIQKYDNDCCLYINNSYKILEYYEHIKRPQMPNIPFEK